MKPKVYLETTIPSYLAARPSRDLLVAAHEQVTRAWWDSSRHGFRTICSGPRGSGGGCRETACLPTDAWTFFAGVPVLPLTNEVLELAEDSGH